MILATTFRQCLVTFLSLLLVWQPLAAIAQTAMPSPAMIQQIKSLPRAQQEALAKQYGVDLKAIMGAGASANGAYQLAAPGQPIEQVDMSYMQLMEFLQQQQMLTDDTEEETPERFGLALFEREVSTFAPTDNTVVPDDYRLGVGDELVIQLFGKENEQLTLPVSREGQVFFPKLGAINVNGLRYEDAKDLIQQRIAQQLIGVDVIISLGRLRAINVFLAGEVMVPGAYSVSALSTVSQAIYQAGGVSDIGTLRNIQIKRNGEVVGVFDVYDLLLKGDGSADLRLRSGDVVFVPTFERLVTVEGEVKRPMLYEVAADETVKDVIAMAGGYKSSAFKGVGVLVQRGLQQDQPVAKNLKLTDTNDLAHTFHDGDILRIMPVGEALSDAITVKGAVVRPGVYGWTENLKVSDVISDIRRDVLPNADLGYALLVHEINDRLDIEVEQFDLAEAVLNPDSADNLVLSPRDHILVFEDNYIASLNELAQQQKEADEQAALEKKLRKSRDILNTNTNTNTNANNGLMIAGATGYIDQPQDEEQEISENIRSELLKPVLERLRNQARAGKDIKVVSISGAVKFPGEYPLPKGYKAKDLIAAAGGLKDSAYLDQAEFRRLEQQSGGSNSVRYLDIDLENVLEFGGPELASRDHITVHETVDWNPSDTIVVEGEVMFPGTYLIQRGETLSDVVRRAGGLTEKAFPEGAEFSRKAIAEIETERAREFAQSVRRDFASSVLTEESVTSTFVDIEQIARSLENFEGKGRLLVKLKAALSGDQAADIAVVDGDKLVIPSISNTVTVVGEVRRQGTHSFQKELSVEDYLGLSAGITARADDEAIYIVRADGSVSIPETSWTSFTESSARLFPGDTIVVPVNSQHKESITLWRDITQIIYQGAVSIAAVARL